MRQRKIADTEKRIEFLYKKRYFCVMGLNLEKMINDAP